MTTKPKTGHTPGPWMLHPVTGRIVADYQEDDETMDATYIEVADVEGDGPVPRANATLMSAAPDMLEALELALELGNFNMPLGDDDDVGVIIRKAIAKARGEV